MRRFFMVCAALLAGGVAAFGYTNVLENSDSQTITNGWDAVGDMIVGDTTPSNTLIIAAGGSLINTNGYVGAQAGASDNTATVSGTGAEWINTGTLQVGAAGNSNNVVSVSNGGTISAAGLTVFTNNAFNLNSDGNLEISGAFKAGQDGFNWNDGGALSVGGDLTGMSELDGTNKTLTLNGGTWDNGTNDLVIGRTGLGNSVTVSNNGVVSAETLTVAAGNGFHLNQDGTLEVADFDAGQGGFHWADGGNLSVDGNLSGISEITGSGKTLTLNGGTWTNEAFDFTIGTTGSVNSLTIQSGGVVSNANAFVGANDSAVGNSVTVEGENSRWISTGLLTIGSGNNSNNVVSVDSGGLVQASGLDILSDNSFKLNDGGTLKLTGNATILQTEVAWVDGGHLWAQADLDGFTGIFGNRKTLTLDGGDYSGVELTVGFDGIENKVVVTNGGSVTVDNLYIGNTNGNTVSVGGTNSTLKSNNALYVGHTGSNNKLKVSAFGSVENAVAYVGGNARANGNTAEVSGENSSWINTDLNVGRIDSAIIDGITRYYTNRNNRVTVSGGGTIQADTLGIENGNFFDLSDGGTLRMTDVFNVSDYINTSFTNLNWGAGGHLSVGGALSGITNVTGGRMLTLNGTGATWDLVNTNILVGGDGAEGSTLVATHGAVIRAANFYAEGSDNVVNVESDAWLLVGDGATTNTLANGGVVVASTNGAELTVNDFASLNIAETLQVGDSVAKTGTVSVANNGTITVGSLSVDTNSTFNLNDQGTLRVEGDFISDQPGFKWNEGGHLSIGGELQNLDGLLQTNRLLTIGGSNAVWNLDTSDLVVGSTGSSNELYITDGGSVANANATVGATANAWDNAVVVGGSNAVWNNTGTLTIGATNAFGVSINSGNFVTVTNNGTVIANALTIYTNNLFNLSDGGTLRMTGAEFDVSKYINTNYTTLNWESGGNLAIQGTLTGMATTNLVVEGSTNTYTYLDGGHIVTIDTAMGNWLSGGDTNLIVGLNSSNNGLIISNTGKVSNANGYIGWGSEAANNSVLVSGAGSAWTNRENLYVGGYTGSNSWNNAGADNSLTVESNGWVFVGEAGAELSSAYNGGIGVASTNGAELVVGNGSITAEQGFHIGVDADKTGSVTIRDNGTAILGELNIATNSEFNLYGTLRMTGDFDVSQYVNSSFTNLNWNDGGKLVMVDSDLSGISTLSGSNKIVTIEGGSWSNTTSLSIDGDQNKLMVSSNSLVTSDGAFIGSTTNDFDNAVTLSGNNAVWENSGDLSVGYEGSGNSLTIESGATNNNVNGYIGFSAEASGNEVWVTGSNSVWNNSGNLFVGYGGSNSTLTVKDYGYVSVGTNLVVQNSSTLALASSGTVYVAGNMTVSNATVEGSGTILFSTNAVDNTLSIFGTNSQISADVLFDGGGGEDTVAITENELIVAGSLTNRFVGFENLNMTNSLLGGTGMVDAFPNINLSGGWIAPDGELTIDGVFVASNTLLQVTAGADSLRVADSGGLDLDSLLAEVTISNSAAASTFNEVILTADGGLGGSTFSSTNFIEHFLLYDFFLTNDLTTVSVVSEAALDGEIGSALAYAGIQGIRAGFNGMQNAAFVRTKQLRRNTVATDDSITHEHRLMREAASPAGPRGPGDQNTIFGMHFWAEQFSGQGDYDAMGLSDGFTLNNNGTSFGFDRLFGDSLVAGINYTYARSAAQSTGGDQVDTETYWLGIYGEWFGKNDYYLEGLVSLGWSDYTSVRTDVGYIGEGTSEGSDFGGHIEAGKYFHRGNWAMAPYAGLNYLWIKTDAYTEIEQASNNELDVDGEKIASLESVLGVKLRNRFDTEIGRFQTVGYAEWAYDFINDDIDSTLSDGTTSVATARIAPGASLINAGVGFSWICTDSLEVGVGYDGRFNENYEEHMGTIMLDVRF